LEGKQDTENGSEDFSLVLVPEGEQVFNPEDKDFD
jgi:hypothetical protein